MASRQIWIDETLLFFSLFFSSFLFLALHQLTQMVLAPPCFERRHIYLPSHFSCLSSIQFGRVPPKLLIVFDELP